jgi:hypothetical protein
MKRLSLIRHKSVLMLCAGVLSVLFVSAQVQQTSAEGMLTPKVGVKGGVNFTNLYVDDVDDENMKAGLNLGLFAKFPVTRGFSIQPELLYSSKGSKISFLGSDEYRFNLNYLELPVLGVINVARNFNIHAGAYAAYLTQANIKQEDNGTSNESLIDFDEDDFNRFDYGLIGGIGFDVQNFTLGARYNYGLNQVGEEGTPARLALRNAKNSAITVYVGYGF